MFRMVAVLSLSGGVPKFFGVWAYLALYTICPFETLVAIFIWSKCDVPEIVNIEKQFEFKAVQLIRDLLNCARRSSFYRT